MDGQDSVSSHESTTTDAFFCGRSMGLKRHIIIEDDFISDDRPQSSHQTQTKKRRAIGPSKGLKSSTKALTILATTVEDNKGQSYLPDQNTHRLKNAIDEWRQQEDDETVVSIRHDDVLSRVLGNKDHTGRALGVGDGLGIKAVWGSVPRVKTEIAGNDVVSRAEMEEKMAELEKKLIKKLSKQLKQDMVERINAELEKKIEQIFQKKMMGWATKFGFVGANIGNPIIP